MKKVLLSFCLIFSTQVWAQPKLVVGIVVDQLRTEYLYRYQHQYSVGGFKRLQSEGFTFLNAHYDYAPTVTAPGHASIYTGTTPAFHGIAGNDWYNRTEKKHVYCVSDNSVSGIGTDPKQHRLSPKRLQASTITDQLKLSTAGKSKVIGLSIKDRGAILPAGHAADGAYWYDQNTGNLVTSSYYHQELPNWVKTFNKKALAVEYTSQTWNTLYPINQYTVSAEDDFPGERSLGNHPASFPYPLEQIREKMGYKLMPLTPWGNTFIFDAAYAAIQAENLGQNNTTDFLCLSFSTPDYMGHAFGPQAIEIQDMYLRFDLELAKFLQHLDKTIGKDNYLIMLSADHGANENLLYLNRFKIPGDQLNIDSLKRYLNEKSKLDFNQSLILDIVNEQVYFDRPLMDSNDISRKKLEDWCKLQIQQFPGIYGAIGSTDIENGTFFPRSKIEQKLLLGYHPTESGDLMILTQVGWMEYSKTGTTHGSAFSYDTHVPIMFFGYKIPSGFSHHLANISDIAPTLAAILQISQPNACIGNVLSFTPSSWTKPSNKKP